MNSRNSLKRIALGSVAAVMLAMTGACAGDADVETAGDDDVTTTTSNEGSAEAYCEFAAELDSRPSVPPQSDLDRIVELAPEEIKDDVEILAQGVAEENFEDPEVMAAGERLEAWEDDNCPPGEGDTSTTT